MQNCQKRLACGSSGFPLLPKRAEGSGRPVLMEELPDFEGEDERDLEPVTALPARPRAESSGLGGRDKVEPDARPAGRDQPSQGDKAPRGEASGRGDETGAKTPWVLDRVLKALKGAKDFDEFRKHRPFRFLHMFSGEVDQLGIAIKAEAAKARLEVYVEALDRKKDKELNLASPIIYKEIGRSISDGEWDGFHSGFPCSSFSRVRWRDSPGGPLPVRSAAHIYGLPGNTHAQQREADDGTLMATQSAWLHEKQVNSCKRREIPEVSTLENPPGAENTGSAWDLPEVKDALTATRSSSVEFNTCAYQSKLKRRWFKPARWAGKLETMSTLAKVCKCPAWVQHVPWLEKGTRRQRGHTQKSWHKRLRQRSSRRGNES